MFDIFYTGNKPNLFPFELPAKDLNEAAAKSRTKFFWFVNGENDYSQFDFSWHSVPWEYNFVHVFPDQWQKNSQTYFVKKDLLDKANYKFQDCAKVTRCFDKCTTDILYTDKYETIEEAAKHASTNYFWYLDHRNDYTNFDFSWHCDVHDQDYVHVFADQWQANGGVYYVNKKTLHLKKYKFQDCLKVTRDFNKCSIDILYTNQYDSLEQAAKHASTNYFWYLDHRNDYTNFDFSWHSDIHDQDYIHVFSSQWHANGGVYYVKKELVDNPKYKFQDCLKVTRCFDQCTTNILYTDKYETIQEAAKHASTNYFWYLDHRNDYSNFDFSWHCSVDDQDYIHVFPSQWQANGGVYYVNKKTLHLKKYKFQDCLKVTRGFNQYTDILYTDKYETIEEAAKYASTEFFWYLDHRNDYSNFDFSWHCDIHDQDYIHVFPSQWHANGGVYYVNKKTLHLKKHKFQICQSVKRQIDMSNWIIPDGINISNFDFSWHPNPLEKPYEYHFPTQWQSAGGPIYKGTAGVKLVSIQKVKSLVNMSKWFIPADVDLSEFDFSWHPNPFDPPYSYQFPTQHQRDGGPVYLGTAGIKYCNQQHVNTDSTQIFYMDFLNAESSQQFEKLEQRYPDIKRTRYVDSYLNVFRRIISLAKTEFVWIISSICDYKDFDFTWHPESSQREMIHCFASGNQKRGDTFYINVESFKNQMYSLEILDWFNVINYISDTGIKRFDSPVHTYCGDNLVEEIKKYQFTTPYAVFTNQKDCYPYFTPCLWSEKDRVIESFANSKAICAVPRDAKLHIKTQVYDYPYVQHDNQLGYFAEQPLDIVYISNGEPNEQEYWEHLNFKTTANWNIGRLHWVKGINGRNAAYKEAARLSQTPWFFAVFAKLRVDPNFNFTWQPDYFQSPKHYIFHALNPVNGLEYGHQAMIAYNRQLTLNAVDTGLDFTLSAAHEVVPIRSGIAEFNQDPWMTWRTAFREVIKLKHFSVTEPTVETDYRLKKWLTVAQGQYADNCIQGANDAVEYYNSVNGDFDKLKLSYEWAWLKQYFNAKYQK